MFQHSNDFIVCLITVEHPEATDRTYPGNDISVRDSSFCQHTNIQGVTVALNICSLRLLHRIFGDQTTAITLRDKAIESRYHIRILLRTVDLDVSADFVQFILYCICRYHFYKCSNHFRSIVTYFQTMPRM